MTQIRDDVIPEDLSVFVHDAAGALPGGTYELERVMRRQRSHRRRTVTGLSLVGVIVMAVAVAIPLALRANTAPDLVGAPNQPAQRLYYYVSQVKGDTATFSVNGATIRVPSGIVEVDGRGKVVVRAYLDPKGAVQNVIGLPDGGLAAVDLRDGKSPANDVLTVVAPDGKVRVDRVLGRWDGSLRFVGATGEAAYLMRRDQLVRHDFTSGKEQPAAFAGRIGKLVAAGWSVESVVSDRVLLTKADPKGLQATVLDLSTGNEKVAAAGCAAHAGKGKGPQLMLSPDGRHLACYTMVAPKGSGPTTSRLTIGDLSTGRQVFARDFGPEFVVGWYKSLAWTDDHTLQLAALQLPAKKDRVYDIRDVLKVETIKI
jgi:hypothetical protein